MAKDMNGAVYAAIAMALHEYKGNNIHDKEPGVIKIKEHHTLWNAHFLEMTHRPNQNI